MIKRAMGMGKLRAEGIPEYLDAHDNIHPDFVGGFYKAGYVTISCFLLGTDLAVYSEVHDTGYEKAREELGKTEEAIKFGKRMASLPEPGTKSIEYKEVFHMPQLSNGKPIAQEKRVLSLGKLKSDVIPEYIRHHDEIKPEFLDAFREAGIINISCFLHETNLLVYVVRDEAIYAGKEEWLNNNPLHKEFMALMKPLADPASESVFFPEVFRLPKIMS